MSAFKYEVIKKYGVISEKNGYSKELRKVAFGDNAPKYDLRTWNIGEDGNERMGKGVTLTRSELETLSKIINTILGE